MTASTGKELRMFEDSTGSPADDLTDEHEDLELRMLNARRMLELRKKMTKSEASSKQSQVKKPSDREIVLSSLIDRGDEVLRAAESRYPKEMARMLPQIARLIKEKKISTISGGELLQFLRSLGLRVSVKTSISVEEHGKFVSLADKLKREN